MWLATPAHHPSTCTHTNSHMHRHSTPVTPSLGAKAVLVCVCVVHNRSPITQPVVQPITTITSSPNKEERLKDREEKWKIMERCDPWDSSCTAESCC